MENGMDWKHIEQMRAHVDDGGKLTHRNALDLLAMIEASIKPISAGAVTGFRQVEEPCGDCIDDWCQMNCGPALTRP